MKILITGGAGFIGSYLARALIWRGDDVVCIDNFNDYYDQKCKEFNVDLINLAAQKLAQYTQDQELPQVYEKLKEFFEKPIPQTPGSFQFTKVDILDYDTLSSLFQEHKFDAVVHLAAMAGVPKSTKMPRLYCEVNLDGTTNLLDLSAKHNVKKFLFASSSSVYGLREDKKVKEEDPLNPHSVYGATKVGGEQLCHAFYKSFDLNCVVIRIFGPIYGPLQRSYGMLHQRALNYVHNNKTLSIYGRHGLETAKDSTYIDDEIDGFIRCLDSDLKFEIFNLGTSNPQPIKLWLDAISKAYGKEIPMTIIEADKADVSSSADITKAKDFLGYNPKFDQQEGCYRQVEVFKMMPEWFKTMENV